MDLKSQEQFKIDKIDILILYLMISKNKVDDFYSIKIKDIHEYLKQATEMKNIAYYTVVRRIKKLVNTNYIIRGYKIGNADTYYLSPTGIKFMENNILNKNTIYEYDIEENIKNEVKENNIQKGE